MLLSTAPRVIAPAWASKGTSRCCLAACAAAASRCMSQTCFRSLPAQQGVLKLWRNICLVSTSVTCDEAPPGPAASSPAGAPSPAATPPAG